MSVRLERHGDGRNGWRRGCRCDVCRRSLRRWARVNNAVQRVRRGAEPASRVPAGRARRHVERLVAAGLTMSTIAARAGVAPRTLYRVVDVRTRYVSRITERLVLAVPAVP